MAKHLNPKWLLGKRVVAVELNKYRARESASDRSIATNPVIFFEDGSCISFLTQETDYDTYGTEIIYTPRARQPNVDAVKL